MPTVERPLEDMHLEVFAPTGGFIFGVSVFGDTFGGETFRFGVSKFGDLFSDVHNANQWVDYIADATTISYTRGAVNSGATNTVQVGLMNSTFRDAANPLTDYKIRAGRKVRLRYDNETLFSGKLFSAPGRYVRNRKTFTKYFNVNTADAVKKLAALQAYGLGGISEPYETFEERIERILDTYDGLVEWPTGNAYPSYRLGATVYEGSLAAQLDLACNSVGASWYVDKLGQVRFSTTLTDYITAVFTDGSHTEPVANPLKYYGLNIEYDPKNHINYLELVNRAVIDNPDNPGEAIADDTTTVYGAVTSIASNEILKASLETTLYTGLGYENSLDTRAAEILTAYSDPKPTISKLYFNVQENFTASQLETLHLVEVWHEAEKHTLRVAGISATINPTEWLLELDLVKE